MLHVWVYSPSTGDLRAVATYDDDPEAFAAQWCGYFENDIYFFADLEPI